MNKKVLTEDEIKKKLKISDWRNLSKEKVMQLIQMSPNIDKEVFLKILEQIPHLVDETKVIINAFKESVDASKSMSIETKKYYTTISNRILDLLESDKLSDELKIELKDLLVLIANKMDDLDNRDKVFMSAQLSKFWDYAGKALLVFATIFGVKFFLEFLNSDDFI